MKYFSIYTIHFIGIDIDNYVAYDIERLFKSYGLFETVPFKVSRLGG